MDAMHERMGCTNPFNSLCLKTTIRSLSMQKPEPEERPPQSPMDAIHERMDELREALDDVRAATGQRGHINP